jgi:predicted amidophosphoribosyltransferase
MLSHPTDQCPCCKKPLGLAELIERWCEDCGRPTDSPATDRPRADRPQRKAA